MDYLRKNLWSVGITVLFVGSLVAMVFASKNSSLPSPTATAKSNYEFVITESDHVKGPATAKVTIVEFSDFQCPACKSFAPIIDEVVKQYPLDVRFVYKHFPLKTIHFRAESAAFAAEAASNQGKFWEMHDLLFENQDIWSKKRGTGVFEEYALKIGLDVTQFKADIDSDQVKEKVRTVSKFGVEMGINSTPTFYINGKKIENPKNLDALKALIDAEIAKSTTTTAQ